MNRGDAWLGNTSYSQLLDGASSRAGDTARTISQKPGLVVVIRRDPATKKDIELPPQTVRIEIIQSIRSSGEQHNTLLTISKLYVIFLGLRDHPTLPNFDCLRSDRIFYNQRIYEIVEYLDNIPGRLMASIELTP